MYYVITVTVSDCFCNLPHVVTATQHRHSNRKYTQQVENYKNVSPAYIFKAVEARYDINQICTVRSILELVFIRSGYLEFSDTSNSTCISACKIEAFIQFLCTS